MVLCLGLWAAPGAAQTPPGRECDPQDPKKCSQPLLEGQAAPFAGQLLTPRLAIDLGQKASGCDARMQLELDRVNGLAAAKADLDLKLLTIERDSALAEKKVLQDALAKTKDLVPPPPWYERPAVVATLGVVVTVGVMFLAVKTVQWTTK